MPLSDPPSEADLLREVQYAHAALRAAHTELTYTIEHAATTGCPRAALELQLTIHKKMLARWLARMGELARYYQGHQGRNAQPLRGL